MRIDLNYGKDGLALELADDLDVHVIRKPAMPVLTAPEEAVRAALASPVGSAAARRRWRRARRRPAS